MPAKKSKGTVGKTKKSHGKVKNKGANKSKIKASKRSAQARKRKDKYREKQRKERKRTERAKRTAKKTAGKKKGSKKPEKKSKDKKNKKDDPKKPDLPAKLQRNEEDEDEESGEESSEGHLIRMRFVGLSVPEMQDLRQKLAGLSKDEFLEHIKNQTEGREDEARVQSAYLGSVENRMKLFTDQETPTDSSNGPFRSNRFGAVFLLPGQ